MSIIVVQSDQAWRAATLDWLHSAKPRRHLNRDARRWRG
jgi:hypothetical protein